MGFLSDIGDAVGGGFDSLTGGIGDVFDNFNPGDLLEDFGSMALPTITGSTELAFGGLDLGLDGISNIADNVLGEGGLFDSFSEGGPIGDITDGLVGEGGLLDGIAEGAGGSGDIFGDALGAVQGLIGDSGSLGGVLGGCMGGGMDIGSIMAQAQGAIGGLIGQLDGMLSGGGLSGIIGQIEGMINGFGGNAAMPGGGIANLFSGSGGGIAGLAGVVGQIAPVAQQLLPAAAMALA